MKVGIAVKRVYDKPDDSDGARVLVDKLWPRGIRKTDLIMDAWYKSVTPSAGLRKWFHEDLERWPEFRNAYLHELSENRDCARQLLNEQKQGKLTLLYAAKDNKRNHALVLKEYLEKLDQHNT